MTETAAHQSEDMPASNDASPRVGEVITALPLGRSVVVRLAHPVVGHPTHVAMHSTLLVPSVDVCDVRTPVVTGACTLTAEHLTFGGWAVNRASVTLGGMWESALLTMPLDAPDPSTDPDAGPVLASLLSDAVTASTGTSHATESPTELTTSPLTSPTLRVSLRSHVGQRRRSCCELFVADGMAIEWLRLDEGSRPLVSYFSAGDLPLRLLERCGLGRLACIGRPSWQDQEVDLRCTHLGTDGLALETLAWTELSSGVVSTSEGPATPMALVSQVLGLLPGGDPHDKRSDDPGTSDPGTRIIGSPDTDTPGLVSG